MSTEWLEVAKIALDVIFKLGVIAVVGWVAVNVFKIWHHRRDE